MKALQAYFAQTGGPEVIRWHEVDLPEPGPGEIRVVHEAVGLNFIDTYYRSGLYPCPLPSGLGSEAAGVVEAVGPDVGSFKPGDRVATFGPSLGAYATARITPASGWFRIPDGISAQTAAAAMLKGCTAECLVERAISLKAGEWALVHAAAGGMGQILVQWLSAIGVRVVGTVGSEAKVALASKAGAEAVLLSSAPDVAAQIREITGGIGVAASFDGVGAASWPISLASVRPRGTILSFGNASGPVIGVALGALASAGSLYVTRPRLWDYYATPAESAGGVARLFEMLESGAVKVPVGQSFALSDAADAHRALEGRQTVGSSVLVP